RVLFENDWYVLRELAPGAYELVRTARPFADAEEIELAHEQMTSALEHRRPRAILVDLRAAPMNNDPAFERSFAGYRTRIVRSAGRAALLVRTKAGRLHAARLAREDGVTLALFEDEPAARAWLLGR
ncbi:MAG TPA: hypothetical protein VIL20_27885, partial [Sandaracinaceae bacterium]